MKFAKEEIGTKIAMHIAASNPLAIDKERSMSPSLGNRR